METYLVEVGICIETDERPTIEEVLQLALEQLYESDEYPILTVSKKNLGPTAGFGPKIAYEVAGDKFGDVTFRKMEI